MPEPIIIPLDDDILGDKRNKLKKLLTELSKAYLSDSNVDYILKELSEIYDGGYRQMYSEIFPIIVEIHNTDQSGLDFLTENMEYIRGHMRDQYDKPDLYPSDLYGKIIKLSDHINLEVQRLREYKGIRQDLSNSVNALSEQIENAKKDVARAKKKVRKMQTEVVVILGIFAAIVMAMSGSLSILGSSMEEISTTNSYKITFVILICGMISFNTIAFLMSCIKNIVSELYDDEDADNRWHSKIICFLMNNGFIIGFNIIMFMMLLLDTYCWVESNYPL